MEKRTFAVAAIVGALSLTAACGPAENRTAPAPAVNANTSAGDPASFGPGTAQYVIANQPDYQADVTAVTGPSRILAKVAKKGANWRTEMTLPPPLGRQVYYIREGQPALMVLPERREYAEIGDGTDTSLLNPLASTLEGLQKSGVKFERLGVETVDGHSATKYRGTKEGEDAEMVVYTANDLKDLIIKIEARRENVPFTVTWTNIVLDVPDSAVQPPADITTFKKIDASAFGSQFAAGAPAEPPPSAARP